MKSKVCAAFFGGLFCLIIFCGCRPSANDNSAVSGVAVTDADGKTVKIGDSSDANLGADKKSALFNCLTSRHQIWI